MSVRPSAYDDYASTVPLMLGNATGEYFTGYISSFVDRIRRKLHPANKHPVCYVMQRHTMTSADWLRERAETVYKQMPGFSTSVAGPLAMDAGGPRDLPEALMGESWELVQYPLSDLQNELQQVDQVWSEESVCARARVRIDLNLELDG